MPRLVLPWSRNDSSGARMIGPCGGRRSPLAARAGHKPLEAGAHVSLVREKLSNVLYHSLGLLPHGLRQPPDEDHREVLHAYRDSR